MRQASRAPMLSRWLNRSNPTPPSEQPEAWVGRTLPLAIGAYMVYAGATGFLSTLDVAMRLYPSLAVDARPSGLALWSVALAPFAVTALAGAMLTRRETSAWPLAIFAQLTQVCAFAGAGVSFAFTAGAHVTLLAVKDGPELVAGWGPYVHIGRQEGPSFATVNFVPIAMVLLVLWCWRQNGGARRRSSE